jgi:ribonuclease HII
LPSHPFGEPSLPHTPTGSRWRGIFAGDGFTHPLFTPRVAARMTPARKRLRLKDPLRYERDFWDRGVLHVAGVDEVGRGPLAGPVVAAAVVLPQDVFVKGVSDSKMVPAEQRTELAHAIRDAAVAWGVGAGSAKEIDRLGITVATKLALRRALEHLRVEPGHVVLDGRPVRDLGWTHKAVVKADYRIHCVACASILAKVCRDDLMDLLHVRYPAYGWNENKGYGTEDHRAAIGASGASPHHRFSFSSVTPPPIAPTHSAPRVHGGG